MLGKLDPGKNILQYVNERRWGYSFDIFGLEHLCGDRHIFKQTGCTATGHHYILKCDIAGYDGVGRLGRRVGRMGVYTYTKEKQADEGLLCYYTFHISLLTYLTGYV